jgi:GNAT superfamily N-acetyltransferase
MQSFREINGFIELGKVAGIADECCRAIFGSVANLDIHAIVSMVDARMAKIFVVENGSRIVGFSFVSINRNFFRADIKEAECQVVYIKPDYRGNGTASKFLYFIECMLKHDGIDRLIVSSNLSVSLERFYRVQGFKSLNSHMVKELK